MPLNAAPTWIESLPCPMLLIAMEGGDSAYANRRARDLLGLEIQPSPVAAVFHAPNDLAPLLKALRGDERLKPARASLLHAKGTPRHFWIEAEKAMIEGREYALLALQSLAEHPVAAESSIGEHHALWRAIFDKAGVGIVVMDAECRFVEANQRWMDMFGFKPEDLRPPGPGANAQGRGRAMDCSENRIGALMRGEIAQYRAEKSYISQTGVPFWGDLSVNLLRNAQGTPAFVIGFLQDITDRKRTEEQLQETNERLEMQLQENQKLQERLSELAVRDALTGLYNRRYMEETLRRELSRAAREQTTVSVVMLDLDHFKDLNDTHGHLAGDHALRSVANLLQCQMRTGDVACRYGGEEFVAILPGASLEIAASRAESWRAVLENLDIEYEGLTLKCTLSVGVSEFPRHGFSGDELLSQADSALYIAKRAGRNRVMVWG